MHWGRVRRVVVPALLLVLALGVLFAPAALAKTLTVTSTADSGPGSLRAKIAAAKPGDTVFLPSSKKHYMVTKGKIKIAVAPITILGAGAGASVIDASRGKGRVFEVTATPAKTSTIRFQAVTITGGNATTMPGGGGILVDRVSGSIALNLTLIAAIVTANKATVSTGDTRCCGGGGGIYSDGGDVSLVRSSVSGNTANIKTSKVMGTIRACCDGGGGIYDNYRNISLNKSQVNGNSATVRGYRCCHGGGGIYSDGLDVTVVSSQISGNRFTLIGSPLDLAGTGGSNAICCSGGGAIQQLASLTRIRNSTLSGNKVTINSGDCCQGGGAIFDDGGGGSITSSRLANNIATVNGPRGAGHIHCCSGGGALAAFSAFTISNSTLDHNLAKLRVGDCCHGGGAIQEDSGTGPWRAYGTTFSNNTATFVASYGPKLSGGGAVYEDTNNKKTGNSYTNSTFSGNSTNAANPQQGGGALFLLSFMSTHPDVLANVTLASNGALLGSGGAILNAGSRLDTKNSILALNHAAVGPNCAGFVQAGSLPVFTSLGYNLENKPDTCNFTATGDKVVKASAVKLGPLAANGGPTFTRALLPGSPAIDAGNPAGCTDPFGFPLKTDQRGRPRPSGPRCDIGAFEFQRGKRHP